MKDDLHLVQELICLPLVEQCPITAEGPDRTFSDLTRNEQLYLAMWHFEAQVNNGGFMQFYVNLGNWLAEHVLEAYQTLGLEQHAALVRRAMEIASRETSDGLPRVMGGTNGTPSLFEAYQELTQASDLPKLDDLWHALCRRVDEYPIKAKFALAHENDFPHTLFPHGPKKPSDLYEYLDYYTEWMLDIWDGTPAFAELTPEQRAFLGMMRVEQQVSNGGFNQVYSNGQGPMMHLALKGYRAIGATEQATIIAGVMEMIMGDPYSGPGDLWPDPDTQLPDGHPSIGDFDDIWYACDERACHEKKRAFIQSHEDLFPIPRRW